MALIKCKECGKEISSQAKLCPNCGKPTGRSGCRASSLIIVIGAVFIFAILISNLSKHSSKSPIQKSSQVDRSTYDPEYLETSIKTMFDSGFLSKIDANLNVAFIEVSIWNGLDYNTKENMSRILAFYCGYKKGTNLNWVDIKDKYSGKKIAKYSKNWGFKIY